MIWVNEVKLSEADKDEFRRTRAIKLKGLFTTEGIEALRSLVGDAEIAGDRVVREVAYDVGNESSIIQEICGSPALRRTFAELFDTRVMFSQGLYFGHSADLRGFPWHFGLQSFAYIRHQDVAVSMWVPLDPIDTDGQAGGFTWVPRDFVSAYGASQMLARLLMDGDGTPEQYDYISRWYRDDSAFSSELFDRHRIEPSFDLGDCVLFDRYVWHRSCEMRPGPRQLRRAYVMRFVDYNARCSKLMPERLEAWRKHDTTKNPYLSRIPGELADIEDGQLIRESSRFATATPF